MLMLGMAMGMAQNWAVPSGRWHPARHHQIKPILRHQRIMLPRLTL
jgi:hypothetical protein